MNLPIILVVQLNREAVDCEPSLAHLRQSGTVEDHTDHVLLLWQPEEHAQTNVHEIIIAKQRNGPAGVRVLVGFDKTCGRFAAI